jgi:hypothetical protein
MTPIEPPRVRRNRIIAIAAGAITVIAIVLAFASGYLGQQWNWLRPAGELLLLAELVGLIVLERHQLFEPVQETVGSIKADTSDLRAMLTAVAQQLGAGDQVTVTVGIRDALQLRIRLLQEASTRDQEEPQVLRYGLFSGDVVRDARGLGDEWPALTKLSPSSNWCRRARPIRKGTDGPIE